MLNISTRTHKSRALAEDSVTQDVKVIFGMFLPFMKDNDELELAPVFGEIRGSREFEEFC